MKIKQTIKTLAAVIVLAVASYAVITPTTVAADCGGVETSLINCEQTGEGGIENTGVWGILLLIINILTVGVGVAAVGGIVYGSILYTSAGGNSEQTKKAMGIITNVVIGVIAYAGMYALMNFLIPGGIFR